MKGYKRLTKRCGDIVSYAKPLQSNFIGAIYEEQKERDSEIMSRLAEIEDKIERGEIDYVATVEPEQTIIDLITEFDEMSFAPTTLCPDPEQFAIDWRDQVRKEFARLTAENTELKARLERAIELPVGLRLGAPIYYLQYFCDYKKCSDTTQQFCCGCPEMIERERKNEKYVICQKPFELKDFQEIGKKYFLDSEGAEARLAELKRGRE